VDGQKKVIFFVKSVAKLYTKLNYLLNLLNHMKPKYFVRYIHEIKINYGTLFKFYSQVGVRFNLSYMFYVYHW